MLLRGNKIISWSGTLLCIVIKLDACFHRSAWLIVSSYNGEHLHC